MDNFQLYRTNPLLSGQVKWDLILNSSGENLVVSDFMLSPISPNITYGKYTDDDILKYSHQDNVKKLYKNLGESFFDACVDPNLNSEHPIITDKCINSHIGDYEMGCRRNKNYQVQRKQFQFLCPVWLECLKEDQVLAFKISVYIGDKLINSKSLVLNDIKNETSKAEKYHKKFISYFKKYLNDSGISNGNDNLININYKEKTVEVSGLDVNCGEFDSKIRSKDIYSRLVHRERTLLENDSIILNALNSNNIIAPQLFNFSLYFNHDDILPIMFIDELFGKPISFKCEVGIGTPYENNIIYKQLEMTDFYTNYEYIPKEYCGPADSSYEDETGLSSPNVLQRCLDYKHVDLITKNKMLQSVFHWSLYDNNDYIFNLYPGFNGFTYNNGTIVNLDSTLHADTPDLKTEKYSKSLNNMGWCNWVEVSRSNDIWDNFNRYLNLHSDFSNEWIHNIRYKKSIRKRKLQEVLNESSQNIIKIANDNLKVLLLKNDSGYEFSTYETILKEYGLEDRIAMYNYRYNGQEIQFILYNKLGIWSGNDEYDGSIEDAANSINNYTLLISSRHLDLLTFKSLYKILEGTSNNQGLLNLLKKDLDNEFDKLITGEGIVNVRQSYPANKLYRKNLLRILNVLYASMYSAIYYDIPLIKLENTIYAVRAASPFLNSTEILYHQLNRPINIYRYCGKIKPTFTTVNNYIYYKDYISDKEELDELENVISSPWQKSIYAKLNDSNYIYPSVGYCAIKRIQNWNYYEVPVDLQGNKIINDYEYSWFNNGVIYILKDNIECTLESELDENGEYVKIKDLVKKYIGNLYKIKGDLLDYIFGLYEYESEFDYKDVKDIKNYIYKIKIKLI